MSDSSLISWSWRHNINWRSVSNSFSRTCSSFLNSSSRERIRFAWKSIKLSIFCKWLRNAIWYCSSASSISLASDLMMASFLSITLSNVWLSTCISLRSSSALAVKGYHTYINTYIYNSKQDLSTTTVHYILIKSIQQSIIIHISTNLKTVVSCIATTVPCRIKNLHWFCSLALFSVAACSSLDNFS